MRKIVTLLLLATVLGISCTESSSKQSAAPVFKKTDSDNDSYRALYRFILTPPDTIDIKDFNDYMGRLKYISGVATDIRHQHYNIYVTKRNNARSMYYTKLRQLKDSTSSQQVTLSELEYRRVERELYSQYCEVEKKIDEACLLKDVMLFRNIL